MRSARPLSVLALVTGLVALPLGPAAAAEVREADQLVVAEASAAKRTVVRTAVEVVTATGDRVDNENVARAVSSDCTGCRAIAVAFQAVLVPGTPTEVVPQNGAAAFNVNCTSCTTGAFAFQYVVSTNGVHELDDDAEDRVEDIAERVREVARSGRPGTEIAAELDRLEAQFQAAVDAGLTGERELDEDDDDDLDDDDDDD